MKLILIGTMMAALLAADVRVSVRLGAGHPVRRPGRTVIVRPTRVKVAPGVRIRYLPVVVVRRPVVVVLPARPNLHWEDRETIQRREDWVDMDFHVDNRGRALYYSVDARAQVDFAEVHFGNGEVQVVDFNDATVTPGTYRLLDIADGRAVRFVRMVARARAPKATFTMYLAK